MSKDNPEKKSMAAMAAILGASIGMHVVIAEARGIEADDGEGVAPMAGAPPMSVAQDINVRREPFMSRRKAIQRPSNQFKLESRTKIKSGYTGSKAGRVKAIPGPMNVTKMPGPPAPFVPAPLPNASAGSSKNKTLVRKKTRVRKKTLIRRKR